MGTNSANPQVRTRIKAGPFIDWLTCIDSIVDEFKHHVTEHGFRCSAVEPANAAMVRTTLGANEFEDFNCENFTFGINTSKLLETLGKAETDDIVSLEITDNFDLSVEYGPFSRTLPTIDPDVVRSEPDIPDLDYLAKVIMPTDHYKDAVWSCDMVADSSVIEFDPEGSLVFKAQGDGSEDARMELGPDHFESAEIEDSGKSNISIDYQNEIIKSLPSDLIELWVGDEFPIKISSTLGENSRAEFHIAPRIKEN